MNNFTDAQKAYKLAIESSGSATTENERYLTSLSAKLSQLRAEFERLVLGDGGISSFIKGVVDAGTALLKFANSDIGQTILMVGALTGALNLLSKSLSLLALTKTYKNFADLGGLTVDALKSAKTIKEVGTTLQATASLGWEMIPMLGKVGIAIAGVVGAVYLLQKANKALYPTIDDLTNKLNTSKTAYEEAENKVKSLKEQIENNKKAIADLQAQGGFEITNSGQIQMLKTETAYLETQLGIAQQMAEIKNEEERREARKVRDTPTSYTYTTGKVMTAGEIPELQMPENKTPIKLETIENASLKPVEAINRLTESLAKQREEIVFNQHIIDRYQATLDIYNTKVSNGENVTSEFAEEANKASSEIDRLRNSNSLLYEFGIKPNTEALSNLTQSAQSIIDVGEDTDGELKKAIDNSQQLTGAIVKTVDASGNATYSIQALTDAESENGEQADGSADKNEALQESLSAVSKAMKPVEKAQKEYAKSGKITSDTIIGIQAKAQKLGRDFTDLLGVLSNTDSTTQDVNNAFGSMIMQILEASRAFDNLTQDNADLVENLLEGYGVTNAYAVVQGKLAQQTDGLVPILNNEIASLSSQTKALGDVKVTAIDTEKSLGAFTATVRVGNNTKLDLTSSISNLSTLEQQAWATASAIRYALALGNYQSQGYVKGKAELWAKHDAERETDASIRRVRNVKPTFENPAPPKKTHGGGGGSKGGGSSSAKNAIEEYKKLYKAEHDELEHKLKMDEISETEYYKRLDALNEKYFGEASGHHQDCIDEYRKNQESIYTWTKDRFKDTVQYQEELLDKQVKTYQKAQQKMSKALSKQIDALQEDRDDEDEYWEKRIDRQEKLKDATLERLKAEKEAIEKEHSSVVDNIKTEIDALKKQKDENKTYWDDRIKALEKTNDELDKQKQLAEKLEALEKAKATRVKVFKNGRFVYDTDKEAVSQAQKNLNEYKEKLRQEREKQSLQDQRDAEQKNYQDRIDALENYRDQQDKYYDDIEKRLKENYDATEKSYSKIIDALKEKRDKAKKEYDEEIKDLQKYQKEQEEHYQQMVDKLNEVKDKYSDALKDMENAQKGFLDSSKAFTYDFSKSIEENMKALNEFLQMTPEQLQGGAMGGNGQVDSSGGAIRYTNPDEERTARMSSGSSSTPTHSVPDGHGGTAQSTSTADKYGGVVSKHYTIHSKGADSLASDEMAVVGENPNKEIVVGSKLNNGVLMKLSKDSGVVNSKSTRTFAGLLNSLGDSKNLVEHDTNVNQTFHFGNITLPNVTDGNSFARELSQKFNNYAIQYGNIRK